MSRGTAARPEPDVEVFIPVAKKGDEPVSNTVDDEVFVPEKPAYRPLVMGGLSQEHNPLEVAGKLWRCRYGCPGVRNMVADLEAHTWDCPYWEREGREKTPFDDHSVHSH